MARWRHRFRGVIAWADAIVARAPPEIPQARVQAERPAGGFLRHRESGLETGFRPKKGARRGTFGRLSPNHSDFANTAEVLVYFVHSVGRKTIPSIKRVCPRIVVQYPQGRLSAAESNIEEILAKP